MMDGLLPLGTHLTEGLQHILSLKPGALRQVKKCWCQLKPPDISVDIKKDS